MATDLIFRTICQRHGFRPFVGSAVQFALDYYECPKCVREQDAKREAQQQPCCSRMNIDCCGHDEDSGPLWRGVAIESPSFCNSDHLPEPPF